ncbi:hypothetical protein I302_107927 [Kwoniella bestiolae CBS 10118]|uniref:Major facilitator superfamily (MFS) profile domain-containing protein n=1 Tax=Kwoniella bestiolae CBS 10118 TaxID=1296100 RepID=A0AAJ8MCP4_9TREE
MVTEKVDIDAEGKEKDGHVTVLSDDLLRVENIEKDMGAIEALKLYPWSVVWSVVFSLTIGLIGSLYAQTAFKIRFGDYYPSIKGYQVPAPWQAALTQASNVGIFIGIWINGLIVDRLGYKKTALGGLCFLAATLLLTIFAVNRGMLFAGEFLCGLPWGTFIACAPAYASEVAPIALRGVLTTYINLAFVIGQFIAAGVLLGVQGRTDTMGWKIPFIVQEAWPVPLFILICLTPESPWWYVRHNRVEEAEKSLRRLRGDAGPVPINQQVAMMVETNRAEMELGQGEHVTYSDCFKGTDLRRTEIVCLAWASQLFSGQNFTAYMTYFFTLFSAGLKSSDAFKLNLGNYALGFVGTVSSWFLLNKFGRRKIFLTGISIMTMIMGIIGCLYWTAEKHTSAKWGQAGLLLTWTVVSDASIGPVVYAIVSETSSTRLRAKSVGLARNAYTVCALCFGFAVPFMMNAAYGNLKGKTAFLFFGTSILALIWAFFRLPECKGRSYRELDILFDQRISARKFATADAQEHPQATLHV